MCKIIIYRGCIDVSVDICHQHRSCSRNIIHPDSLISFISDSFYMVLVVLCHGIFSSRLQIIGNSSLEQVQNQLQILLEETSVVWRFQIIQECILKKIWRVYFGLTFGLPEHLGQDWVLCQVNGLFQFRTVQVQINKLLSSMLDNNF